MEIQQDSDLCAIIQTMPAFGRHANLIWTYVELFGISPLRAKTKKLRLLLDEMKVLLEAGAFSFQKKRYQISREGIAEALNIIVHRHFETLLENHNYLKKIMISIAEREASTASREAEKQLRQKENRLLAGGERPASPEEVEANIHRIQKIIKGIG